MSVGILLVTHPGIGSAMLNTATRIIGRAAVPVKCLEVPPDSSLDTVQQQARGLLEVLDRGGGVLVLTDIFGATPHNVAQRVAGERPDSTVLSGLNLAMLVRVFNYPQDDLASLAVKASEGGIRDIMASPAVPAD
jgi:PTS system ascorbate-specific IIA component